MHLNITLEERRGFLQLGGGSSLFRWWQVTERSLVWADGPCMLSTELGLWSMISFCVLNKCLCIDPPLSISRMFSGNWNRILNFLNLWFKIAWQISWHLDLGVPVNWFIHLFTLMIMFMFWASMVLWVTELHQEIRETKTSVLSKLIVTIYQHREYQAPRDNPLISHSFPGRAL